MSKAKETPKPVNNIPRWVWIFTPTIALTFVAFIIFLGSVPTQMDIPKPKVTEQNFGFYGQLNEKEAAATAYKPEHQKSAKTVKTASLIQAGSFRSAEDADRMRGQLLLSGLDAYVESTNIKGSSWHRVMIGPFTSRSRLNSAQDKLAAANITAIVKKVSL